MSLKSSLFTETEVARRGKYSPLAADTESTAIFRGPSISLSRDLPRDNHALIFAIIVDYQSKP